MSGPPGHFQRRDKGGLDLVGSGWITLTEMDSRGEQQKRGKHLPMGMNRGEKKSIGGSGADVNGL